MDGSFTVFYDGHFWVGVLELRSAEGVRAARHIFGAEPTNAELLAFAGREFDELARRAHAAPPVPVDEKPSRRPSPKRAARLAGRAQDEGIGTAAQRALKEELAQRVAASARRHRRDRAEEAEHRRQLAREKARARHRGKR